MTDYQRIDHRRINNDLKFSKDESQSESNIKATQNFETKVDVIHTELRKDEVTKEDIADG